MAEEIKVAPQAIEGNIPQEYIDAAIASDPEFAEIMKEPASTKEPGSTSEGEEPDPSSDEAPVEETPETDEVIPQGPKKKTEEEELPEEEAEPVEFEDNVIEGVTGKDFGSLPEAVQTALGTHHEKYVAATEKLSSLETRVNELLKDPIVMHREALIRDGKADLSYEIPSLTAEEKQEIIKELGLDETEVAKMEKLFDGIATKKARALAYNLTMQDAQARRVEEAKTTGRAILTGLAKFNKALEGIEPTEIEAILTQGPRHPKFAKWEAGLGKVYKWCVEKGLNYGSIAKFKPNALYAAAAAELDLPVAPSAEVMKKIAATARQQALQRFLKPVAKEARGLSSNQGNVDRRQADTVSVQDGVNIERLAADPDYYEAILLKKPNDPAWMKKVGDWVDKGEAILAKKQKR